MTRVEPSDRDSNYEETCALSADDFSKEQRDIALAAALLQSAALTERQLASALGTWTIHGSVPLADHLAKQGLIDDATRRRAEQQATAQLQGIGAAEQQVDRDGTKSSSPFVTTLENLDRSGKVGRLLGIRSASGTLDQGEHRQTDVRYKLVRKLGQGGIGRVWLAFDENMKRYVAVKEISAAKDPATVERFRREAEITGRLEHPGIVPVYELGTDATTGESFYAMRFLGKRTLHDSILEYHERRSEDNDDPMIFRQLLSAFISVCQALGHAHSRKVIHRDLKPENVAIDNFGQVIVIDWGLAKVIDEVGIGDVAVASSTMVAHSRESTLDGQVLGTPLYMAPEQAAGRIDDLDERTDIYGLGAILFAILTGYAPHEQTRSASSASGVRDLISAIASEPTPPPGDLNPDLDPALGAICAKAMAKRQYARYETASQLADDISRWMAGEPVSAYKEKPSQRVARWIGRHRIWSQVIAVGVIVLVVSLITLAVAARQNSVARQRAQFDQMLGQVHEIEVQLHGVAESLSKNARFMATLPPIQGIMDARAGVENAEDEAVWCERLATIYEGLLHANPDYLTITYSGKTSHTTGGENATSDAALEQIVRVERPTVDTVYVQRVPKSRLANVEDKTQLEQLAELAPGEVSLSLERSKTGRAAALNQHARLVATIPVYDETSGTLFGMVTIESNLVSQIREIVQALEQTVSEIFVTGSGGKIWLVSDPKHETPEGTIGADIATVLPQCASFFASADRHETHDRDGEFVAQRVQLDPADPDTVVGLVLHLEPSL